MSIEINHGEREHSKFSASGAERRNRCGFSVEAEEKSPPSIDSFWSKEGTLAHEVLEAMLNRKPLPINFDVTKEMVAHVEKVARKIRAIQQAEGGLLLVEKRVYAMFIHPEMFGTCDAIIIGDDGTLHIIDFKYGAGHIVDAKENQQLLQYALSVAESYGWELDRVKMWIMQPRAGEDWHKSWVIPMRELKEDWADFFKRGVARALSGREKPNPGHWCHYCRAKNTCPAKQEARVEKVATYFNNQPLEGGENGIEEKSQKEKSYKTKEEKTREERKAAQSFGGWNGDAADAGGITFGSGRNRRRL